MLEGILVTMVLSYIFSYIAVGVLKAIFDRPSTPKQQDKWRKKIDEDQKLWLSSPEFQKLNQQRLQNQELLNSPAPSIRLENMEF